MQIHIEFNNKNGHFRAEKPLGKEKSNFHEVTAEGPVETRTLITGAKTNGNQSAARTVACREDQRRIAAMIRLVERRSL
jgi:hypothetical protein